MSTPSSSIPLLATVACIVGGLIIGFIGGISNGSLGGGVVAGLGVIPACWAAWAGMQKKTQGSLATALLLLFASLGVAALLLVLWVISKF